MKIWFFYIGAVIDIIGLCVASYFMLEDTLKGRSGTNNPTLALLTFLMALLLGGVFFC